MHAHTHAHLHSAHTQYFFRFRQYFFLAYKSYDSPDWPDVQKY